jgi:hypothetical protein
MNIFNFKAKLISANQHDHKYLPDVSLRGVLRTNDPLSAMALPDLS